MALVSMDVVDDDSATPSDYDPCPHIYLNSAQVAALGITTPPRAGTQFTLTAVVEVASVTEVSDDDADDGKGQDITLTLDVEYAEISPSPKGKAAQLYADQ